MSRTPGIQRIPDSNVSIMSLYPSAIGTTRRQLLQTTACGFGSLAMRGLLAEQANVPITSATGQAHFAPRASRVIFLFIQGGPSQPDLFDPKPYIEEKHGQTISPGANEHKLSVGVDKYLALKPIAPIRPRGNCGMLMSRNQLLTFS